MISGPAASASPGNLGEMQVLRPSFRNPAGGTQPSKCFNSLPGDSESKVRTSEVKADRLLLIPVLPISLGPS